MADIDFYQDESEDPQDDDDLSLGCEEDDSGNPDESLTPLQRLEKYMDSVNVFNRQMAARNIHDTIRTVEDPSDCERALKAMVKLSEDVEVTVRSELMEQLPHVAMYCHENSHLFDNPIPHYIVPTVVSYLTAANNQVRKTSQAALLVLLEQGLVERHDVEEQVCPVIMELSGPEMADEFRPEAVALMSKMAQITGKELTEQFFLHRFADMCTDALFHVRKVCAANFGDMCSVVGQDNTEKYLLPKFYYLCEDGVWGVRKACAECFMAVSCSCTLEVRRNELASLFISLICDQSRWVRMAAFQALGAFISTFADPSVTGLYFSDEGILIATNPDDFKQKLQETMGALDGLDNEAKQKLITRLEGPDSDEEEEHSSETQEADAGHQAENSNSSGSNSNSQTDDTNVVDMDLEMTNEGEIVFTSDGYQSEERAVQSSTEMSAEEELAQKYLDSDSAIEKRIVVETLEITNELSEEEDEEVATQSGVDSISSSSEVVQESDEKEASSVSAPVMTTASDGDSETAIAESTKQESAVEVDNTGVPDTSSGGNSEVLYNSFQYWRTPLPDVDLEINKVAPKETYSMNLPSNSGDDVTEKTVADEITSKLKNTTIESGIDTKGIDTRNKKEIDSDSVEEIRTASFSEVTDDSMLVANIGSTHVLGEHLNETPMTIVNGVVKAERSSSGLSYSPDDKQSDAGSCDGKDDSSDSLYTQDVIPQALLDHYLSMTDPARAQTVDSEIARHCAYSLPAVAYTLGRRHWPCLKELYETLATDMQWKVRRTLAFSIHELAVIVGEEVTNQDLVPVFNEFLKDLDEVRIGILKHLADFLRLVWPNIRHDYLRKIPEFLNTDNNRNWRFREELAEQLLQLPELYSATDVHTYLIPIALTLAEDKVAQVRRTAFAALSSMMTHMAQLGEKQLLINFMEEIVERFAKSEKWNRRQIFAQMSRHLLSSGVISAEMAAQHLLPNLLALSSDPIPNVRISLAYTLSHHVLSSDYFTSPQNPSHEVLLTATKSLQSDPDRDVRDYIRQLCLVDSDSHIGNMIPV